MRRTVIASITFFLSSYDSITTEGFTLVLIIFPHEPAFEFTEFVTTVSVKMVHVITLFFISHYPVPTICFFTMVTVVAVLLTVELWKRLTVLSASIDTTT